MTWPSMTDKPLQIPFLAPSNFAQNVKRWLKRFLRTRKHLTIPFHLPKCNVREAAHTKVADALCNPFSWQEFDLFNPESFPCPCTKILPQHQSLENIDGHICATLDQFHLPQQLQILQSINSYSTVYPTKVAYLEAVTKTFQNWLKKHGLAIHDVDNFQTFLQDITGTSRDTEIDH